MAELDAVIKGLNLGLSWQMKDIELMTDSLTVHRWLNDSLSGRTRLKTKAASEMLIRRRMATILALVEEHNLNLGVTLVRFAENRADALTRNAQKSLHAFAIASPTDQLIAEIHCTSGHPGVKRTLYFAKRRDPTVSKKCVSRVVSNCHLCRSIDPAPVKWRHGNLGVERIWQRVSIDVTQFRGKAYLTLINCGPSRFAIWRPLKYHTSVDIYEQLESIF
ncbi:hypothetical protein M513_13833, partial [Trichuris suis]